MNRNRRTAEILIVGAGPAGIAAAVRARESGSHVLVLDDNPAPGGQIWRNTPSASIWFRRLVASGAEVLAGTSVVEGDAYGRIIVAETQNEIFEIEYGKLILATGARELFLPFPGWTLPNVMGVGGLQALVKSGLPVAGKRIIVAGTGPLLLAAATYVRKKGAVIPVIAEQASWTRLAAFTLQLLAHPAKLLQAAAMRIALRSSRYLTSCWVEAGDGDGRIQSVRLRQRGRTWQERCDYLAIAYKFKPNIELPALLNCECTSAGVRVNAFQKTSQEDVYCAGECTGVGGVELSILEGEIAGYAASGRSELAARLFRKRSKARQFAAALEHAFAPRHELKDLPRPDTIVCRCEDVTWQRLQSMPSWRTAKLYTRCGMGPCQGRICGPILEFMLGLQTESVRPPVFPARIGTLVD
jgi:NADPH-dependent 2,4-dienoyl-CoA reductase/sulfur reductase-like enzyme